MSFYEEIKESNWEEHKNSLYSKTEQDVFNALSKGGTGSIEDFKALISPAAAPYLEQMARLSQELTLKRFGKTIQLYIPLYLSNECTNGCIYCGFKHENKIDRKTLSEEEILKEALAIKKMGFKHLLLVTGEHPKSAGFDYLKKAIEIVKPHFSLISAEVQPLEKEEYAELVRVGLNTVYIYQETYRESNYKTYHPKGKKSDFEYRLKTPERLGAAEIYKVGLGCLIGLEDWRTDSLFVAKHLRYLQKNFWKAKYSIAFPRIRPYEGAFQPNSIMSDKELVQLICAYRIFDQDVELSLSTREKARFRDHMMELGVTSMSAGSITQPGGYADNNKELEQFEVSDDRSPAEIVEMVRSHGYEAVWKDWDVFMQ